MSPLFALMKAAVAGPSASGAARALQSSGVAVDGGYTITSIEEGGMVSTLPAGGAFGICAAIFVVLVGVTVAFAMQALARTNVAGGAYAAPQQPGATAPQQAAAPKVNNLSTNGGARTMVYAGVATQAALLAIWYVSAASSTWQFVTEPGVATVSMYLNRFTTWTAASINPGSDSHYTTTWFTQPTLQAALAFLSMATITSVVLAAVYAALTINAGRGGNKAMDMTGVAVAVVTLIFGLIGMACGGSMNASNVSNGPAIGVGAMAQVANVFVVVAGVVMAFAFPAQAVTGQVNANTTAARRVSMPGQYPVQGQVMMMPGQVQGQIIYALPPGSVAAAAAPTLAAQYRNPQLSLTKAADPAPVQAAAVQPVEQPAAAAAAVEPTPTAATVSEAAAPAAV